MFGQRADYSLVALVAANTIPAAAVLFLGWDAKSIVLMYWVENLVIGAYHILRILLFSTTPMLGKLFVILFFSLHFGGFCAVHGLFLLEFFHIGDDPLQHLGQSFGFGPLIFLELLWAVVTTLWQHLPPAMGWAIAALVISHGVSFAQHEILGQESRDLPAKKMMTRPYQRIVVMHIVILAGAFPVILAGSAAWMLLLLIIMKIALDLWLHRKVHRARLDAATVAASGELA